VSVKEKDEPCSIIFLDSGLIFAIIIVSLENARCRGESLLKISYSVLSNPVLIAIALQYKFRTGRIGVAILNTTVAALVTLSIIA